MHRIEEDTAATSAFIDEWRAAGLSTRLIRSHRAPRPPRTWLRRHTRAVAALVTGALALGGSAVVRAEPAWIEPPADVLAAPVSPELTELLQTEVTDTPERRVTEGRTSRSQRRAVAPPKRDVSGGLTARWVAPLVGKLRTTSCYGEDRGDHAHQGVDFDGETGDVVRSVGYGRVVQAGWRFSGAGLTVTVQYGDTLVLYAHLSKTGVSVGQRVGAGQRVGDVGSTGHSTGSHLHLGVAKTGSLGELWSNLINPAPWLEARGVAVLGC